MTNKKTSIVFVLLLVVTFSMMASASWLEATLYGEKRRIWSYPQEPYLTLSNLGDIIKHKDEVLEFLPSEPFKMDGKWVFVQPNRTLRTVVIPILADMPEFIAYNSNTGTPFSRNGEFYIFVRAGRERSSATTGAINIRVIKTDASLVWETKQAAQSAVVTDDGRAVAVNGTDGSSLLFFDNRGQVTKRVSKVFDNSDSFNVGWYRHIPSLHLVLFCDNRQLVAYSYEGVRKWSYAVQERSNHLIGEAKLDPLGRGVYVLIFTGNGVTVDLIDDASGRVTPLWQRQPFTPRYFSQSGRYAATSGGIGMADWKTGQIFYSKILNDDGTRFELSGSPIGVSDSGFLAASVGQGVEVFDIAGKKVWSVNLRNVRGQHSMISRDGKTLAVIIAKNEWLDVGGILLYKIG